VIPVYVLDSCALIAMFYKEPGGQVVSDLLARARTNLVHIKMSKVNLLEFYYDSLRQQGKAGAQDGMALVNDSPIQIIPWLSDEVFEEAGRLKAAYKISLADSIALAEARTQNASLVTCDHHEFDPLEQSEPISFLWIR
jgi:predicted nucleic acid-binding protein